MSNVLINDLFLEDLPDGGAEHVNDFLAKKCNLDRIRSNDINSFNQNDFYVVSNIARFSPEKIQKLLKCNYIIFEHGYQILNKPRRPCRFDNCIVPPESRINYDLYAGAQAVFVQTTDHLNVFLKNDVKANFINLKCSIWSDEDLNLLNELRKKELNPAYSIYKSRNGIKNTHGAIKYCEKHNLQYELIGNKKTRREFLERLSRNKGLVFLPKVRETFSRLAVEAKCMGVDVVTTKTYGAVLEDWYDVYEEENLVNFLKDQTTLNIENVKSYLPSPTVK